jgi:hypothetical protein
MCRWCPRLVQGMGCGGFDARRNGYVITRINRCRCGEGQGRRNVKRQVRGETERALGLRQIAVRAVEWSVRMLVEANKKLRKHEGKYHKRGHRPPEGTCCLIVPAGLHAACLSLEKVI